MIPMGQSRYLYTNTWTKKIDDALLGKNQSDQLRPDHESLKLAADAVNRWEDWKRESGYEYLFLLYKILEIFSGGVLSPFRGESMEVDEANDDGSDVIFLGVKEEPEVVDLVTSDDEN
ncbi:UNVERIFIED_CONTAM: hypothetical protein Sindi_0061800 [Sesamum indicum]